jgi:hypothetical protein
MLLRWSGEASDVSAVDREQTRQTTDHVEATVKDVRGTVPYGLDDGVDEQLHGDRQLL